MTARTNRERYILKRNEYDLMMEISKNIKGGGTFCAIRAVSGKGKKRHCLTTNVKNGHICRGLYRDCPACIQQWLNEESEE